MSVSAIPKCDYKKLTKYNVNLKSILASWKEYLGAFEKYLDRVKPKSASELLKGFLRIKDSKKLVEKCSKDYKKKWDNEDELELIAKKLQTENNCGVTSFYQHVLRVQLMINTIKDQFLRVCNLKELPGKIDDVFIDGLNVGSRKDHRLLGAQNEFFRLSGTEVYKQQQQINKEFFKKDFLVIYNLFCKDRSIVDQLNGSRGDGFRILHKDLEDIASGKVSGIRMLDVAADKVKLASKKVVAMAKYAKSKSKIVVSVVKSAKSNIKNGRYNWEGKKFQ